MKCETCGKRVRRNGVPIALFFLAGGLFLTFVAGDMSGGAGIELALFPWWLLACLGAVMALMGAAGMYFEGEESRQDSSNG